MLFLRFLEVPHYICNDAEHRVPRFCRCTQGYKKYINTYSKDDMSRFGIIPTINKQMLLAYHSNAQLNRKVKHHRKPETGSEEINNK